MPLNVAKKINRRRYHKHATFFRLLSQVLVESFRLELLLNYGTLLNFQSDKWKWITKNLHRIEFSTEIDGDDSLLLLFILLSWHWSENSWYSSKMFTQTWHKKLSQQENFTQTNFLLKKFPRKKIGFVKFFFVKMLSLRF